MRVLELEIEQFIFFRDYTKFSLINGKPVFLSSLQNPCKNVVPSKMLQNKIFIFGRDSYFFSSKIQTLNYTDSTTKLNKLKAKYTSTTNQTTIMYN
jgi:hypothetical protein